MPKIFKVKCPKGTVLKKGFTKKAYTRKNGTKVAKQTIKPKCVKYKRLPKKKIGKVIIPPLSKKHLLGKHGYKNTKTLGVRKRHKALDSAIKEYSARKVLSKIGVLKTLHKNKDPSLSEKYHDNMVWLRKKYDNEFKGNYKDSVLYKSK
tara:strand:+ start:200 stop:646 length:447 start_codon:yes stop_codon:yes gene_type:complete